MAEEQPKTAAKSEGRRRSRKVSDAELELLSPDAVAQMWNVSRSTIDQMIADGSLPFVKLRSGRRKKLFGIRRITLRRWLEKNERKGT